MVVLPPSWRDGLLPFIASRPHLDLFLDFDGTLTEIAAHPDDAWLAEATRARLLSLVTRSATTLALVSGRHVDGLVKRIDHPEIGLIGIHGLEWRRAGQRGEHDAAMRARPAIARLVAAIGADVAATPGAVMEDKQSSISLHLRAAEPTAGARLRGRLLALVATEPEVYAHDGSGVVEVRPERGPTKGTAILDFLVAAHGSDWAARTAAVFVGDDRTDEDGFVALRDAGAGVVVMAPEKARPTAARFSAASVADVHELLATIEG